MEPGDRDRYLDLLRGGSIIAVVLGHWLVADLTYTSGELSLHSSLAEVPAMWPLTWVFQVIPVFFFVAGAVNGPSWVRAQDRGEPYSRFLDRRVHRVLVPTVVAVVLITIVAAALAVAGGAGVSGAGAMLLQSLWFLAVYLALVALTPWSWAGHRHLGVGFPALLLALAVLVDVGRVGMSWEWAGNLNVIVVWLLVYDIGYWYADGLLPRRRAAVMSAVGLAALVALVTVGPYPTRMVGVPGDRLTNMHPPTLAVLALAFAQIGLLVVLRPCVSSWLQRPRVWAAVVWVNLSILTMYLWHQFALVAAGRVLLAVGMPQPQPGTIGWWSMRLAWLVLAGVVLAGIVALLGRFERLRPVTMRPDTWTSTPAAIVVVVLLFLGLLGLAGTRITEPVQIQTPLGVSLSPLLAALLVLIAALVLDGDRRAPRFAALAMLAGAGLMVLCAAGYRAGASVLPTSGATCRTAALFAVALAGAAAVTWLRARSGRRKRGRREAEISTLSR
jgi:peptidoglycan/LPS O-acetylase OafA/YrhL